MAVTQTPAGELGWNAVDFRLPATDGRDYALADIKGPKATLIMFICNHCPYVKAVVGRLVEDVRVLQAEGVGVGAIMPNDTDAYPEDDFGRMGEFAQAHGFTFPYMIDRTQETAHAYGAVCTPDFFGFGAGLELQFRGRLDAGRTNPDFQGPRELVEAMRQIAETGQGPAQQTPSMGCSIKWRRSA